MTYDLTPDPAGQDPALDPEFWDWLNNHPGAQSPADTPLRAFRAIHPLSLGITQGLPGDWNQYVLISWGRLVKPEATALPMWGTIKWTAAIALDGPNGPQHRNAIYHRIHALYRGSAAWIEAVRDQPGDFTITPRDFDRCRSEREGNLVLRGWRLIEFVSRGGRHSKYTDDIKHDLLTRARQLKPGRTWDQVGAMVGPSGPTLWRWDKEDREKSRL